MWVISNIVKHLYDHFSLSLPGALQSQIEGHLGPVKTSCSSSYSSPIDTISSSSRDPPLSRQTVVDDLHSLHLHIAEACHYNYAAEVASLSDQMGLKLRISFPVLRLGLTLEANMAWNLDPER